MTETTHRPSSLQPPPLPPRNTNVPDTSIAGGARSTVGEDRKTGSAPEVSTLEMPTISEREGEAQKTKPVAQSQTSKSPAPSETPKPKRKLRPRKAAMTLSAGAVEHLKELSDLPEPKLIRVGVRNRGCSGLAYHLEYVDKPSTFDETLEQDGVKVLIDSKALFSIIGSEMDWVEDKLSQRFVFKNPNIKEQCGCGESFSVS